MTTSLYTEVQQIFSRLLDVSIKTGFGSMYFVGGREGGGARGGAYSFGVVRIRAMLRLMPAHKPVGFPY